MLGEWFEVFTSAVEPNARLISVFPRGVKRAEPEMELRGMLCPGWCRGTFACLCSYDMFTQMSQSPEQPQPPAGGFNPKLALPQKALSHHPPMCMPDCGVRGRVDGGGRGTLKCCPSKSAYQTPECGWAVQSLA